MSTRISSRRYRFHRFVALAAATLLWLPACTTTYSTGTKEAQAHLKLGDNALKREDYKEAKSEFEQALKLDPIYALAKANLGWALHKNGFSDEGIKAAKEANELWPELANGYYTVGDIYYDQKR